MKKKRNSLRNNLSKAQNAVICIGRLINISSIIYVFLIGLGNSCHKQ